MQRQTPMEIAINTGNEKIVKILCKYGANTNERLSNRWMPLEWSIEKGNSEVYNSDYVTNRFRI